MCKSRWVCSSPRSQEREKVDTSNSKGILRRTLEDNFVLNYAAPIGVFFCPEIRAFTGFGSRFLQPFVKSLVTVKYDSNTKMAANGRK